MEIETLGREILAGIDLLLEPREAPEGSRQGASRGAVPADVLAS